MMKRETYTTVPSAFTDNVPRVRPTFTVASDCAASTASSLSNAPLRLEARRTRVRRSAQTRCRRAAKRRGNTSVCDDAQRRRIDDADRCAACLLVTQTEPFGATASVRGATPTAISAILALVTALNTLKPCCCPGSRPRRGPALPSNTMLLEKAGRFAVSGACTTCVTVADCAGFPSDEAVTVT